MILKVYKNEYNDVMSVEEKTLLVRVGSVSRNALEGPLLDLDGSIMICTS